MKDFKSYNPNGYNNESGDGATGDAGDINSTVEFASAVAKAMNGKSESQLIRTIVAEAERGKREGRLTNADLDNFYNTVAPMVDGAKRKKLKEIISKLKSL